MNWIERMVGYQRWHRMIDPLSEPAIGISCSIAALILSFLAIGIVIIKNL